jgi:hypothetical protein
MPTEKQIARFMAKVSKPTNPEACWLWTAAKDHNGYGTLKIAGRNVGAHRLSFEIHKGPIPPDQIICHRCDNPTCVNPEHLFSGTTQDNVDDKMNKGRANIWNLALTHCKRGHAFTPENTRISPIGRRVCRTCARLHARQTYTRTTNPS